MVTKRMRKTIIEEMRGCPTCGCREKTTLPNPYEIQRSDIGRLIDFSGFGTVKEFDVGKKLFLKDGHLFMENEEQVTRRKGKGWREKADHTGKAPAHRAAAIKGRLSSTCRQGME